MNKIDLTKVGKMPTSMETWQFLSDMVSTLSVLGEIAGRGVYKFSGQNLNNAGYVIWNGEVLPLRAGSGSYLVIREEKRGIEHEGQDFDYYVERWVESSSNTLGAVSKTSVYEFPNLQYLAGRISSLQNSISALNHETDDLGEAQVSLSKSLSGHQKDNTNPHKVTKAQVGLGNLPNEISSKTDLDSESILATAKAVSDLNATLTGLINSKNGVPAGTICMWSGKTAPAGWALCDGSEITFPNKTKMNLPDLRGRFVVGYNKDDADYNQPGNRSHFLNQGYINDSHYLGGTGGEKTHKLTISEMPSHSHKIWELGTGKPAIDNGSTMSYRCTNPYVNSKDADYSSSVGSSQPHENRPPYYVLAYIIKL